MSEEDRIQAITDDLEKIINIAKKNRLYGLRVFILWLKSPRGAVMWPYIFKEEYRDTIIDITWRVLNILYKNVITSEIKRSIGQS